MGRILSAFRQHMDPGVPAFPAQHHGGKEEFDLNSLAERSTWDIAAHWYEPFLQKSSDQVTKEAVAAARPLAQQRIADSVDGLVFVKTHAALVKDRGTPTIDMTRTAGAIYVVRNPLDVAISYAKHLGMPIERAVHILNMPRFETDNFPNAVYEFYGSWSQHVASWTRRPHRAVFIVRYEGPPCRSPCRLWPAWPNS